MTSVTSAPVRGITERWDTQAMAELIDRLGIPNITEQPRIRNGACPGTKGTSRKVPVTFIPGHMAEDGVPSIFVNPLLGADKLVLHAITEGLLRMAYGKPKGAITKTWKLYEYALLSERDSILETLGPRPHATIDPGSLPKKKTYMMRSMCPLCKEPMRLTKKNLARAWPACLGNNTHVPVYHTVEEGNEEDGYTELIPDFATLDTALDAYVP